MVGTLGGRGSGEFYYLLSTRPPYPQDWSPDLICTIQTWGRIRTRFHLDLSLIGYENFAKLPVNLNPEIADSVFGDARVFRTSLGTHAVLGDIIDGVGNPTTAANDSALAGVLRSARGRFQELGSNDSSLKTENAFVLSENSHISFGGATAADLRDLFLGEKSLCLGGLHRWSECLGVDMGVLGGVTSRVIYSYPSAYRDADVAFKLLHHSLVHPNQLSHIDRRVRRECTVCGGDGTLFHRFFTCPALHDLMDAATRMCQLVRPSFGMNRLSFLLGPKTCTQVNCMLGFVLNLVKSTVHFYFMTTPYRAEHRTVQQHTVALRRHFIARVKKRIRLEYLAMQREAFNCTWRPLASVQGRNLVFHWE